MTTSIIRRSAAAARPQPRLSPGTGPQADVRSGDLLGRELANDAGSGLPAPRSELIYRKAEQTTQWRPKRMTSVANASERRQQFAESVDRAGDLAPPQRAPDHRIEPSDHGGIEILFQELDIVDAAPAAAWNVNAVGLGRGCEIGLARHIIFNRNRQAPDLDVAFDPQRRVVRDLDFFRGEILDQPIRSEERRVGEEC